MSGHRVKALRMAFVEQYGRMPRRAGITRGEPHGFGGKKPWKDLISVRPPLMRGGQIVETFLRKLFSFKVVEPSEWRRWKKAHYRFRREKGGGK